MNELSLNRRQLLKALMALSISGPLLPGLLQAADKT